MHKSSVLVITLSFVVYLVPVLCKLDTDDDLGDTGKVTININTYTNDNKSQKGVARASELETPQPHLEVDKGQNDEKIISKSGERLGASVVQIHKAPYAAALLRYNTYLCSAVILNAYWLLTSLLCFEPMFQKSHVDEKELTNYTLRVGSSYNNKGGTILKLNQLTSNIDLHITLIKVQNPIEFNNDVDHVLLPQDGDEPNLGYIVKMVAWTPNGHMRLVNAPVLQPALCERFTKMRPGQYVCIGAVQDLNRHVCRKDNGGAIIQGGRLIAIASFPKICAVYTQTHAAPKISTAVRWINNAIYDSIQSSLMNNEMNKMTTFYNFPTESAENDAAYYNPQEFMPLNPVDVPLVPNLGGDTMVKPQFSLYESYLRSQAKVKSSTKATPTNKTTEEVLSKKAWLQKLNSAFLMMPPPSYMATKRSSTEYDYDDDADVET